MNGFHTTGGGPETCGSNSGSEVSKAGCFFENRPLPGSRPDHRARDRVWLKPARQARKWIRTRQETTVFGSGSRSDTVQFDSLRGTSRRTVLLGPLTSGIDRKIARAKIDLQAPRRTTRIVPSAENAAPGIWPDAISHLHANGSSIRIPPMSAGKSIGLFFRASDRPVKMA